MDTAASQSTFFPDPALAQALAPAATDADFAAAHLAQGFTLADLEALALLRSPELKASEQDYRAVLERYSQTEAVSDLLARYAGLTKGLDPGRGEMPPGTDNAGLFPFPGQVALRGEIVRQEATAARETLETSRRTTLAAARRAYWELLFAHRAHANAARSYDVVDSAKNTSAAGYAAGAAPFVSLVRVDIEHGQMKEAIPIRQEALRLQEAEVLALLDLPSATVLGEPVETAPDPESPSPEVLEPIALASRQELRALRSKIVQTELLLASAEAETHPGYSLGLAASPANDAGRVTADGARTDAFPTVTAAEAGTGTPRNAFFGLDEGYIRETRHTLAALRHRLSAEEAKTRRLVREAWTRMDQARREERLFRDKVVPLSRTELDTATADYAAGRLPFAGLLDAASRWFSASLAWSRAASDLGIGRAGLEEAIGDRIPSTPAKEKP